MPKGLISSFYSPPLHFLYFSIISQIQYFSPVPFFFFFSSIFQWQQGGGCFHKTRHWDHLFIDRTRDQPASSFAHHSADVPVVLYQQEEEVELNLPSDFYFLITAFSTKLQASRCSRQLSLTAYRSSKMIAVTHFSLGKQIKKEAIYTVLLQFNLTIINTHVHMYTHSPAS